MQIAFWGELYDCGEEVNSMMNIGMRKKTITFVIPCFRSENTINNVICEVIQEVTKKSDFDYEIIAVNDCSPDNVGEVLTQIAKTNKRVRVINFSKNQGKHTAVIAGYNFANGDYIVDMDDDGQSPVNELWRLMEPVLSGRADYSTAKYFSKKQSLIKRIGSDINLAMSAWLLNKPIGLRFENFSAMKNFVCKEVAKYKNPYPYLEGLVLQATNRICTVPMDQRERADSRGTGFTINKSVSLLLNGLTGFSVRPLRLASYCGILFSVCGMGFLLLILVQKLFNPSIQAGYSSIMATIIFMGGSTMLLLGIIGEYLGRIYISMNGHSQFVIKDTMNLENPKNNHEDN
jgi:undecaprenyl-phosphate 4-deoxy-4-formamido-L-arabinose transferase